MSYMCVLNKWISWLLWIFSFLPIPYNIPMLHLFQKRNLSDSSAWHPLILLLQPDFLQCDGFISYTITSFVYYSICSFTNLLHFFILRSESEYMRTRYKHHIMSAKIRANNIPVPSVTIDLMHNQSPTEVRKDKKQRNIRQLCTSYISIQRYECVTRKFCNSVRKQHIYLYFDQQIYQNITQFLGKQH